MRKILTFCLVIAVTVFFGTAIAQAEDLNIDFSSTASTVDTYGGATGQVGFWNDTPGSTGNLMDLFGNATDVSYSVVGVSFYGDSNMSNEGDTLLKDFLHSGSSGTWSVVIEGLDEGVYDIAYYAPFYDLTSTPDTHTDTFEINGVAMASITGQPYSGTLVQGVNYDIAQNITVGADGILTLTQTGSQAYSGLSGMQISAAVAPEPVSSVLFVVGGTVLGFRKRFLKKKAVLAV